MGAFNKEKVLVRGLLRALWKLREGSLRDHWPVWRWAHTWSPRSLHMSGGPVRAGPHTPARTPPRVGPQLTVVRRVANITQPYKYFYRARSKYFCSDRSVLSMCGMWAGSAGWVIGAMKQRRIILAAKWTLVNIFCGPRGEGDDSQELKICQNGFCFKFCDFNISHC